MKTVDRKTYAQAVRKHACVDKPVEGYLISVMENYDRNGKYFASATYSQAVIRGPVAVTYRVHSDFLS